MYNTWLQDHIFSVYDTFAFNQFSKISIEEVQLQNILYNN